MSIAVDIKNISKKFKTEGEEFYALKDVSFRIKKGEVFGLLGPNGAGKTTLINIIATILLPDEGNVKINGMDIVEDRYDVLEIINTMSGETLFHRTLSVKEILNFYSKLYEKSYLKRKKIIGDLSEKFEIQSIMDKRFLNLSSGQKMRLSLAKSLINSPKLLLLDEPTVGLDPDIAVKTRKIIKELKQDFDTTILLTSHYMTEVEELCKRMAFLDLGKITDIGEIKKIKSKRLYKSQIRIKVTNIKKKTFLKKLGFKIRGKTLTKAVQEDEEPSDLLKELVRNGFDVIEFQTKSPTLEDYFLKMSRDKNED